MFLTSKYSTSTWFSDTVHACSALVLYHRHFVVQCICFSPGAEKGSVAVVPVMNPDNGVEFARSEKGE